MVNKPSLLDAVSEFNYRDGPQLLLMSNINNLPVVSTILGDLAGKAFGYGEPVPEVRMTLQLKGLHSITVFIDKGQIVGYQSQKQFNVDQLMGIYYSITVLPEYQASGVGGKLMSHTIEQVKPEIIAARTQNPAAVLSLQKALQRSGIDYKLYPFEHVVNQQALQAFNAVIQLVDASETDKNTWVQKNVYRGKRLGDYRVDESNPQISAINNKMIALGLDRDTGDAIYYVAILNE